MHLMTPISIHHFFQSFTYPTIDPSFFEKKNDGWSVSAGVHPRGHKVHFFFIPLYWYMFFCGEYLLPAGIVCCDQNLLESALIW